jgi:hypothetical protein
MYNYVNFSALVMHHAEHFDRAGDFYLKPSEENVPEIIQQLEFNCYTCTYCNCFYNLQWHIKVFQKHRMLWMPFMKSADSPVMGMSCTLCRRKTSCALSVVRIAIVIVAFLYFGSIH